MDAPVFIHHKQAGPQRRFQKILQTLTSSNSSNSLHQSHSSKQRLNIHEELIKLQIEQTKEGCNKFYSQQPFLKEMYHNQHQPQSNAGEKSNKRNEDLVKALQQQKGQPQQNEQQNQHDGQADINTINSSSSKQLITIQSISSLPLITEPNQEKQITNQDNNSYYDPDINGREQSQIQQKPQYGVYPKGRSVHKGSGTTLHEIVNKQLQAIRQSRKSLHKDLSFNSINQQNNISLDEQNPNLYLASNTDIHSNSTNIFVKKDVPHSEQASLNMQAYQIRMKEDKIPFYLQSQIPTVINNNISNTINIINNTNTLKYNLPQFKTESIQNSLKSNNQQPNNILEQYQPKYRNDNPQSINVQRIYKKRNQSLNNGQTNTNLTSSGLHPSSNIKTEYTPQELYSVDTNSIPSYLNQSQALNRTKARKDFSLDSKIQTYNVEELTPISKPTKDNKRHTQKITVVRKFNITETTIHKIQKSDCKCSFSRDHLDEDEEEEMSEDSSHRFLTARSKDNFKQDNPIKKIILRRDSFEQQNDENNPKESIQQTLQTNISDRMTKIKLIQNQGQSNSQKSPSNSNAKAKDGQYYDFSSSDEKKNFKSARSNKKNNSISLNTPQKNEKLNKTTIGTDNENEQENNLNSPSLPPILVCTQQEIYKKLYKVKRKKRTIEPEQEEQNSEITLAKINTSKRSSYKQGSSSSLTRKSINRQSQIYGNQQNQASDNTLASHTHVQLNQQIMQQQQPHSILPQIQSIQTNPIYQQSKYMPEIKEEFSQSSRQYYTDGRISSTYTRQEANNNNNNANSRLSKNFTPEEIQQQPKNQPEFKSLVQDLIKCICEFEIISQEETDPVLESYLYNMFAQKNKLQNQLSILNTKEQLTSNTQALINTVKLLIKQQNFIQQYPFHKNKFDGHIQKCEKAINVNSLKS